MANSDLTSRLEANALALNELGVYQREITHQCNVMHGISIGHRWNMDNTWVDSSEFRTRVDMFRSNIDDTRREIDRVQKQLDSLSLVAAEKAR